MKELKEAWIVEGLMPERALDRLQKAGISVFKAKKIKKMQILFHISKKDIEKAFAIYPNMCYNNSRGSVYTFTRVSAHTTRERKINKFRLFGILLGVCCWFFVVLGATGLIFKIEVTGSKIYKREVVSILKESGINLFSVYQSGKEREISAKILNLDGVEFCSVQKIGNTVRVEIRQRPLPTAKRENGDLIAPLSCKIESAVALSGTLLKKSGEELLKGESIVGGFFISSDGEKKTPTHVVAKAKLLCVEQIYADTEERVKAEAILLVQGFGGEIKSIVVETVNDGVQATIEFFVVVKKNM